MLNRFCIVIYRKNHRISLCLYTLDYIRKCRNRGILLSSIMHKNDRAVMSLYPGKDIVCNSCARGRGSRGILTGYIPIKILPSSFIRK